LQSAHRFYLLLTMASQEHKFNDDLLLLESDLRLAAKKYPSNFHVLDHPALRRLFVEYDEPARRAKSKGLMFGLLAIALGFCALAAAAGEILVMSACGACGPPDVTGQAEFSSRLLTVVFFACALASVLIGGLGVLVGPRKREWLHNRLMAESIRQFHFQTFAFRLPEILASLKDDAAKAKFRQDRELRFESFTARMVGRIDSVFAAAIQEEEDFGPWRHDGARSKEPSTAPESKDLDPLFEAYRELRILHQLGYAQYKLQNDLGKISAFPRTQLAVLSRAAFVWIILLLVLHVGLLAGAFSHGPVKTVLHSPEAIVAIIWVALAALATRAIEQGLQPEREIERYQQYRSAVRGILGRFDEASSQTAKVKIMREMEQLAVQEMQNFLITGERSRFVI